MRIHVGGKSSSGTPQSRELEDEAALLRVAQANAPPSRIPLDLRMTEEELRLRAARRALELTSNSVPVHALPAMPNVDDDLMDNEEHNAAAAHFNVSVGAQEPSSAAKPLVNRGPW